jgi:hypothetical protein
MSDITPAQAGEARVLKFSEYRTLLEGVLSRPEVGLYLDGYDIPVDPTKLRTIIDKAYAAGRQHAPAGPSPETLSMARTLIAGQFEHEVTPPVVVDVLSKLATAQPVQGLPDLLPLPKELIREIARVGVREGKLSWLGFDKDEEGFYRIPILSECHYQFAQLIAAHCLAAKGQSQDGLSHRDSGSTADASDSERLDFMIEREAWIGWTKDGESCRAFSRDHDGDMAPIAGWGPQAWAHDGRKAIDIARAAIEAERKQKGGAE